MSSFTCRQLRVWGRAVQPVGMSVRRCDGGDIKNALRDEELWGVGGLWPPVTDQAADF